MSQLAIEPLLKKISKELPLQYPSLSLSPKEIEDNLVGVYRKIHTSVSSIRILKMSREIPLTRLYVHLRLFPETLEIGPEILKKKDPEEIEKFLKSLREKDGDDKPRDAVSLFLKCKKACVLGGPGSGKTTLARFLTKGFIEGGFKEFPSSSQIVPLFLPFKDLLKGKSPEKKINILSLCSEYLTESGMKKDLADVFPEYLFLKGNAFAALDAFDEVRPDFRGPLLAGLGSLIEKYPDNLYLVTSRPAALENKSVFKNFRTMEVDFFNREECLLMVENWFSHEPEKGEKLKSLFAANNSLFDLARTPLLCAFICITFENNLSIPESRVMLYDLIIDLLVKTWRVEKGLEPDLAIERMLYQSLRKLLSGMAYNFLEIKMKVFPEAEIVKFFRKKMEGLGLDTENVEHAPKEVEETTGILVERAEGWYSFSHLTLQEFLAAEQISRDNRLQTKSLNAHAADPDWEEVFSLAAPLMEEGTPFLERLWKGNKKAVLKALQNQVDCEYESRMRFPREILEELFVFLNEYPFFHFYNKKVIDLRNLRSLRDLRNLINLRHQIDFRYLRNLRNLTDLKNLIDLTDWGYMRDLRDLRTFLSYTQKIVNITDRLEGKKENMDFQSSTLKTFNQENIPNAFLTDLIPGTRTPAACDAILDFYDGLKDKYWDLLDMAADCVEGKALPKFHERFSMENDFAEKCAYAGQLLDGKYQPSYENIIGWVRETASPEGLNIRLYFIVLLWLDLAFMENEKYLKKLAVLKKDLKKKNLSLVTRLECSESWKELLAQYHWL